MLLKLVGPLALFAGMAIAAPALADDVVYQLENESSETIAEMYTAPTGSGDWGEDILDAELPPGGSATVTIDDGEATCSYSLRFVSDGGVELMEHNVNICDLDSYTIRDAN